MTHRDDAIKCPKCGSTRINAENKEFSSGDAAAGAFLGPVGVLDNLIGSKKVIYTCLECGKKWKEEKIEESL